MSVLTRFKDGDVKYKASIFERSSRKGSCVCCGTNKYGHLVRIVEPKKMDVIICNECIVKVAFGQIITTADGKLFGVHSKKAHVAGRKRGPKAKPGPKAKAKPFVKLVKVNKTEQDNVNNELSNKLISSQGSAEGTSNGQS